MGRDVQNELARVFAAAVHTGWISVQEGICSTLDVVAANTVLTKSTQLRNVKPEEREWGRLICEQYLDISLPGDRPSYTLTIATKSGPGGPGGPGGHVSMHAGVEHQHSTAG